MRRREFIKDKKRDLRMRGMKLTYIGRKLIPIDRKIRKLIVDLNEVGLETRSSCEGHDGNEAWIYFSFRNVKEVKIMNNYFGLVWKRKSPKDS